MIRIERINHKRAEIIDSINFVSDNFPSSFEEFESSKILMNALYKQTEFAIQNVMDICSIINSDLDLGFPQNDDSILDHIEHNKIFDKKIVSLIRQIKGFRNILVHKYGEIDDSKAYEDMKDGLQDFGLIIKEIENFVKKHKSKKGNLKNKRF